MPRHLRSQISNTSSIKRRAAGFPSRCTARPYWFSTLVPALLQLPHAAVDPFEQIERLEAGDDDRHAESLGQRLVFVAAHDGADVAGPRKPCTRLPGDSRIAVIAGGTSTCDTSTAEVRQPAPLAPATPPSHWAAPSFRIRWRKRRPAVRDSAAAMFDGSRAANRRSARRPRRL